MDEYDRSAIYEVMEQQSVSVAKAGHCTSLPARTAVLAAANPKDGRYDVRKSMMANMNLPAALLSRFDLQFLLLDKADAETDAKMAEHILSLFLSPGEAPKQRRRGGRRQQQQQQQQQQHPQFVDKNVLRAFIDAAKKIQPVLSESLLPHISEWYASTRFDEQQEERLSGVLSSYTTPRALLGLLRLSQALARLRQSWLVETADFEEALRLLQSSAASVSAAEEKSRHKRKADTVSVVFDLLRRSRARMIEEKGSKFDGYVPLEHLEAQAAAVGVSPQQLMQALEQYEELLIIAFNSDRRKIIFVEEARDRDSDDDNIDVDEEN
ncbi:DNA replication licensing factor, putative [Eimeria acervulina]|uniref:DNA replication licensing factor, putative n=1 Tax=Eimeria acervulina TaxID=5801 RepID=U6GQX0_EIMAC|nr:DNA replication licensing factor, putative [Eimeria acervulina]CDI81658.1 DNA replication licensing factor, putative [Eimeria acervulina]